MADNRLLTFMCIDDCANIGPEIPGNRYEPPCGGECVCVDALLNLGEQLNREVETDNIDGLPICPLYVPGQELYKKYSLPDGEEP